MRAQKLFKVLELALQEDVNAEIHYSEHGMDIIGNFTNIFYNIAGKGDELLEYDAHIVSKTVIQVEVIS